jgi:hypothetical protein
MLKYLPVVSISAALFVLPATQTSAEDREGPLFQVFLGVLELDDQNGDWEDISDSGVDVDFSSLPSGGIELEYLFGRGWVHWGLNPGGSISWKNDDTNFGGSLTNENGGTLVVDIDNSLFLMELHLGGFVRGRMHERITTYAAAGPMVIYGSHDVEDESFEGIPESAEDPVDLDDTDSDDINIGVYARAGIDFEIDEDQFLGFSIRYLSTELDFDKTVGKIDIEGPQYVLTYTTRL